MQEAIPDQHMSNLSPAIADSVVSPVAPAAIVDSLAGISDIPVPVAIRQLAESLAHLERRRKAVVLRLQYLLIVF